MIEREEGMVEESWRRGIGEERASRGARVGGGARYIGT